MEDLTRTNFSFKKLFIPLTALKAVHFIVIIGLIVYFNSLFNPFLFDDLSQIVDNPGVHSITKIPDIFLNNIKTQQVITEYFRPLPFTFYAVLYSFFQENTFFYHITQLIFHISNSILIFLIFKRFLKQGIAFFLSILFLIHPINEETVVYIANLQDVLFVFFGLISFYLLQRNSEKNKYIILANIFLFFSVLSKQTAVLFFATNFFYIYLVRKKKLLVYLFYTSSVSIIYIFLNIAAHVPFIKDPLVPILRLSFLQRMINVPKMILYYVKTFLFPRDLISAQSWVIKDIQFSNFILPLLLDLLFIAVLFLLFWYVYKKGKEKQLVILFFAWFLIGLTFHLQIFPLDMTVASRWFYFPMIGLLALIGLFLNEFKFKRDVKYILLTFASVLLVILSLRTMIRNTNWESQSMLIAYDEKIDNNDYLIELFYSTDLIKRNKNLEALPHVQKALDLYPQSKVAWNHLGVIYFNIGDYTKAKDAYLHSIDLGNYLAYENMAWLLISHSNIIEARNFIIKANSLYPKDAKLWYYRIIAEYKSGNYDNALNASKEYYLLKPDSESYAIYTNLQRKLPLNINYK